MTDVIVGNDTDVDVSPQQDDVTILSDSDIEIVASFDIVGADIDIVVLPQPNRTTILFDFESETIEVL